MSAFPTTVATDSDLYLAVNATSTQLTDNPLSNSATTVNVIDASAFPTVGFISIDNEIIQYTGTTGTSFTGCTRGADGTSAVSHVQNSQVFHNVIAAHHNALKNDLIATEQFISDIIGRVTTQIKGPDGSVSLPGHSFSSDTDSGLYRIGANDIALATNGIKQFEINTTNVTSVLAHLFADGTVSLPGLSFTSDPDSGLYRIGANDIALATNGVKQMEIGTTNITSFLAHLHTDGTNSLPGIAFANDTDCGLYRVGTNDIALATNGIKQFEVSTAALTALLPLAMSSNKITGLAAGTVSADGAAYQQVKILQVVMGTSNTSFATTSSTYLATNLSVSITPSSTSSKVFVIAMSRVLHTAASGEGIHVSIFRNGTETANAAVSGADKLMSAAAATAITSLVVPCTPFILDSPATTSAITYDVRIKSAGSNSVTFGGANNLQAIVAFEVNGI